MARRVSWTNNSSGHSGTYVYRAPTLDPQNLPAPVATVDPVAQGAIAEWVDNEELAAGDYDYAAQDFDGQGVSAPSAVELYTVAAPAPEYSTAQIGDEIGGGIYAGTDTINGTDYHIIAGKEASEEYGLQWKTSQTATSGTLSESDGLANTLAMKSDGLANHPAAAHCLSYEGGGFADWHMPAENQLTLLYNNLAGHPEFADNASSGQSTWTSTEESAIRARVQRFSDGIYGIFSKDATLLYTRPIRRVAV